MNSYLNAGTQSSIKTFAVLANFLQLIGLKVVDANKVHRIPREREQISKTPGMLLPFPQGKETYHIRLSYITVG
jgi:hypothetical protein